MPRGHKRTARASPPLPQGLWRPWLVELPLCVASPCACLCAQVPSCKDKVLWDLEPPESSRTLPYRGVADSPAEKAQENMRAGSPDAPESRVVSSATRGPAERARCHHPARRPPCRLNHRDMWPCPSTDGQYGGGETGARRKGRMRLRAVPSGAQRWLIHLGHRVLMGRTRELPAPEPSVHE